MKFFLNYDCDHNKIALHFLMKKIITLMNYADNS